MRNERQRIKIKHHRQACITLHLLVFGVIVSAADLRAWHHRIFDLSSWWLCLQRIFVVKHYHHHQLPTPISSSLTVIGIPLHLSALFRETSHPSLRERLAQIFLQASNKSFLLYWGVFTTIIATAAINTIIIIIVEGHHLPSSSSPPSHKSSISEREISKTLFKLARENFVDLVPHHHHRHHHNHLSTSLTSQPPHTLKLSLLQPLHSFIHQSKLADTTYQTR